MTTPAAATSIAQHSLCRMSPRLYHQHPHRILLEKAIYSPVSIHQSHQNILNGSRRHFHQNYSVPVNCRKSSGLLKKSCGFLQGFQQHQHQHTFSKPLKSSSSSSSSSALAEVLRISTDNNSIIGGTRRSTCSWYRNKEGIPLLSPTHSSAVITLVRNMSSNKHLAKGDPCPPLQEGKVRVYSMRYCPFAERAVLVFEAKGIPYDIVNCNLKDKPEFLLERNPQAEVPVIETNGGKILYESLVVSDRTV